MDEREERLLLLIKLWLSIKCK